jgi:HEPN domain-containing protein
MSTSLDKLLDDPDAPTEILGLHAQQSAEKLLKAILCHAGIPYPRTHQLTMLLDLARDNGIALPAEFEELRHLTPFAVEFRYEVWQREEDEEFNRRELRQRIARVRARVERYVAGPRKKSRRKKGKGGRAPEGDNRSADGGRGMEG